MCWEFTVLIQLEPGFSDCFPCVFAQIPFIDYLSVSWFATYHSLPFPVIRLLLNQSNYFYLCIYCDYLHSFEPNREPLRLTHKLKLLSTIKVKINQKSIDNKKSHRLRWLSCLSNWWKPTASTVALINIQNRKLKSRANRKFSINKQNKMTYSISKGWH